MRAAKKVLIPESTVPEKHRMHSMMPRVWQQELDVSQWQIVSSKRAMRTPIFDVMEERAVGPGGLKLQRRIVRHPGAVAVLARNAGGEILLVRQFRLAVRQRLWELPAGKLEPGERPLRAAKRELAEETGCRATSWRKLLELYPSPGFCDERLVAYFAERITEGEPAPEPYELIEKKWFSWEETMAMVDRHVIRDGKTLAALLYFDRLGQKGARNTTTQKPRGTASRR
jgi:ADP-ribose pyrophosphatase